MRQLRLKLWQLMASIVLAAMILAGSALIDKSREAASRNRCESNLKQIGLGLINYQAAFEGAFPYGTEVNPDLPPERRISWFPAIWGFFEQLFLILDWTEPWDSKPNLTPRGRGVDGPPEGFPLNGPIAMLTCPAGPAPVRPVTPAPTYYVGVAGLGTDAARLPRESPRAGIFAYDRQTFLTDIKDGASATMAVLETADRLGPWTAGGPATVRGLDPARRPYIGRGRPFGGMHPGGCSVLMADGSVRSLRETIDPRVFEALATIAGREPIGEGWSE